MSSVGNLAQELAHRTAGARGPKVKNHPLFRVASFDTVTQERLEDVAFREHAARLLARRNLLAFIKDINPRYRENWFHEELCDTLDAFIEGVEKRRAPRLIIEVPPRHGKSEIVSRHLPPFILGKHPDWEVVTATYGDDLSTEFGSYVQQVLNGERYKTLFPDTQLDPSSNSKTRVGTLSRGYYMALGIGSAFSGKGAHVLVVDDPHKDRAEADSETSRRAVHDWFSSVASTRLSPGGGIICLLTRWHEDDLAGWLQIRAAENPEADQFKVITYPAIATKDEKHRTTGDALWPERFTLKELKRKRATMIARDWNALYQQDPTPDDGIIFTADMLALCKTKDPLPQDLNNYVSVDTAIGKNADNDYSVIMTAGVDIDGVLWFHPTFYHKREPDNAKFVKELLDTAQRVNARYIVIERTHLSMAMEPLIKQTMRERQRYFPILDPPSKKNKVDRSKSLQGRMGQGMVRIPLNPAYEQLVIPQLLAFPAGRHDDIVDAMSHIPLYLEKFINPSPAAPPAPPGPVPWSMDWIEANQQKTTPQAEGACNILRSLTGRVLSRSGGPLQGRV